MYERSWLEELHRIRGIGNRLRVRKRMKPVPWLETGLGSASAGRDATAQMVATRAFAGFASTVCRRGGDELHHRPELLRSEDSVSSYVWCVAWNG